MLAATTDEFASYFRDEVDDQIVNPNQPVDSDRLWKNYEIYRYMTAAVDAVARDVEGIYKILQLPVVTNTQLVPLPRHILHVRSARLLTAQTLLQPKNIDDVGALPSDDYGMLVQNQFWTSKGVPRIFVRDYDRRGILLAPIPTSDDTIEMQCTTTVGAALTAGMPLPFLETPDQQLMLLKMKSLAYRKQDADTFDPKKAAENAEMYKSEALDRKELLESYRRTPGQVQMWDTGYGSWGA